MEVVTVLIISILGLILLFVAVFSIAFNSDKQNTFDKNNKSVTFKKHKFDKKQAEENDKKYKIWKNQYQAQFEKKTFPDEYSKSEKYQKFCEERAKKYNELVNEGTIAGEAKKIGIDITRKYNQKEEVFYGERGGRYRIRYNKNGEPYRDYF